MFRKKTELKKCLKTLKEDLEDNIIHPATIADAVYTLKYSKDIMKFFRKIESFYIKDIKKDIKNGNKCVLHSIESSSPQEYMKNRLGGFTDAYGNTHPNYMTDSKGNYISRGGGHDNIMQEEEVVDDTTTDDGTTNDFFSRYLQNQPDDIREEIEARMQNYYTV